MIKGCSRRGVETTLSRGGIFTKFVVYSKFSDMEKFKIAFIEIRISILEEILNKNIPNFKEDYLEALESLRDEISKSKGEHWEVFDSFAFELLKQVDSMS